MKTSYYASKLLDPARHFLVRISVGAPRFLKHRIDAVVLDFAPTREILATFDASGPDAYRKLYLAKLDALGAARVFAILDKLTKDAGTREPVLLCFEKPEDTPQGWYCHRVLLAQWVKKHGGPTIEELKAQTEPTLDLRFDT